MLNGAGAHVQIPPLIFDQLEEATIECWAKYDAFHKYAPVWSFGQPWQLAALSTLDTSPTIEFFVYDSERNLHQLKLDKILLPGEWFHSAAVLGKEGMKFYLDGQLVGTLPYTGCFKSIGPGLSNYVGKSHWKENGPFEGAIDEFRVWKVARTQKEIQALQFERLQGNEAGLWALWNFDQADARDSTSQKNDAILRDGAYCQAQPFPSREQTRRLRAITGFVFGASGEPEASARIDAFQAGALIGTTTSSSNGFYQILSFSWQGPLDLRAQSGKQFVPPRTQWKLGVTWPGAAESQATHATANATNLDFRLTRSIGISGTIAALDDSPLEGVCVELLQAGKVVARTLSDRKGEYAFIAPRPGVYQVRCAVGGLKIEQDRAGASAEFQLAMDELKQGLDFRFAPPGRKGSWRLFDSTQGLPSNRITAVKSTDQGVWIGTSGGGLVLFDGNEFSVFDRHNGLPSNEVLALDADGQGSLWIATDAGVTRWNGHFTNITTEELPLDIHVTATGRVLWGTANGLREARAGRVEKVTAFPPKPISTLKSDGNGIIWVGGQAMIGSLRGDEYVEYGSKDYGVSGTVACLVVDDSRVWFSTGNNLVRFDGQKFKTFDLSDGLPAKGIHGLLLDRNGTLWVGSDRGISAYNGLGFVTTGWPDKLPQGMFLPLGLTRIRMTPSDSVDKMGLGLDADGGLWLPSSLGVYRFDPGSILSFSTADGLPGGGVSGLAIRPDGMMALAAEDYTTVHVEIEQLLSSTHLSNDPSIRFPASVLTALERGDFTSNAALFDRFGDLWVAGGGGARIFDGKTFKLKKALSREHGLLSGNVTSLSEAPNGEMWVGTESGVNVILLKPEVVVSEPFPALRSHFITRIYHATRNSVWIGTADGEVLRVSENTLAKVPLGGSDSRINAICEQPAGTFWIGASAGLFRISAGDRVERFGRQDGLPSDAIQSLYPDGDQRVWVGTAAGLCRFDGSVWAHLDARDGLAGSQVRSIIRDGNGHLWLGCDNGLSCYTPSIQKPRAEILQVEPPRKNQANETASVVETGTRITVHFRGFDLKTIPSKRRFRVRVVEPGQTARIVSWGPPGLSTVFQLTPERPGPYLFEVQAIDRDLNFSEPARLLLTVQRPWHRAPVTLGFVGVLFVVVIGAAGGFGHQYYQQRRRSRELQLELLEKERSANRAKSLFLANMSHDIRTPLNAIVGYAQILEHTPGLPSQTRVPIETIKESGDGLLSLINSILDISKIEAGTIELQECEFDLAALLKTLSSAFNLACRQRSLEWNVLFSVENERHDWLDLPRTWMVYGDETKLQRILTNLLANAVKFTRQGSVSFRIFRSSESSLPGQKRTFVFEVVDTGPGIDPLACPRLFEPFERSRHSVETEGSGLGLAIARKLSRALGGDLSFESRLGSGSAFRAKIPLLEIQTHAYGKSAPRDGLPRLAGNQSFRALVVDDDATNREVLMQLLALLGANVRSSPGGAETIALVEAWQPSIIFMDIRMPGLDGFQIARALLDRHGSRCPKLIAYSASTLVHEREKYLRSGFHDFLAKPATLDRIQECLEKNLGLVFETPQPVPDSDFALLPVPEQLKKRLLAAAEVFSSTELMRLIDELEQLGPHYKQFAERLRHFTQTSEMDRLTELLDQ